MEIVWRVIIAIVAVLIISRYIQPLLVGLLAPFGTIIVIVLFIGIVLWVMGKV